MEEQLSALARALLRTIGIQHPIRLALCAALASTTKMLVGLWASATPTSAVLGYLSAQNYLSFGGVFFAILFLPLVLGRNGAAERVSVTVSTFEEILKRANLPKSAEKMYWMSLVRRYLESVSSDLKATVDSKRLAVDAIDDIGGESN